MPGWIQVSDRVAAKPFRLSHLVEGLARCAGWRRHGLAVLAGSLATLALPPAHFWPALVVAVTLLLWLWRGQAGLWAAARLGWSFGFGFFACGLYWIGFAFLVEAERFAAIMPLAVLAMAGGMALFPALALALAQGLLSWLAGPRPGDDATRLFAFAAAWLATEWLRSWIFTGFSWNQIGTVWSGSPAFLQLASVGGVWLLSALALVAAGAPSLLAETADPGAPPRDRFKRWILAVVLLCGLPGLSAAYGWVRLAGAADPRDHRVEGVVLRLVQPAIPQDLKWRPELRRDHVVAQMQLSSQTGEVAPTHVIWAETAVPYLLSSEPELAGLIARAVPPGGLLITGAPRRAEIGGRARSWNSLHALDPAGRILATYDKAHLVPFGEYMPLEAWFDWSKLTPGAEGFTPGKTRPLLELPGLPGFSPLICYEIIFPGQVLPNAPGARPAWLLNITNDAWFGISSGPHQHFATAVLRAVEEGLPVVRVANNGISGTIDAYGRVVDKLGLGEKGFLDTPLPRPAPGLGLFAQFGNWILVPILVLLAILGGLARRP